MNVRGIKPIEDFLVEPSDIGDIQPIIQRVLIQTLHNFLEVAMQAIVQSKHIYPNNNIYSRHHELPIWHKFILQTQYFGQE